MVLNNFSDKRRSGHYEELFEDFKDYFEGEMDAIGDETLEQELDIIKMLSA